MTMSDPFPTETVSAMTEERRRELAIQRIKAKHDFRIHLLAYAVVNAALVVVWFLTSEQADGGRTFFWPVLPIVGWGIGLVFHAYVTYFPPSLTEDDIQREMKRLR